jgi:tetratricopeptide (TPR) repeat protein
MAHGRDVGPISCRFFRSTCWQLAAAVIDPGTAADGGWFPLRRVGPQRHDMAMTAADITSSLEITVAALTIVQGFTAARDQAHVNAARDLVGRLGASLVGQGAASQRNQLEDLLVLARRGLRPDPVAHVVNALSWVWVLVTASLGVVGVVGTTDAAVPATAAIALAVTVLVAVLGTVNARSVRASLAELRYRSDVGLLASASQALEDGQPQDAVNAATRALARNPQLTWAYLLRAQAHQVMGSEAAAAADLNKLVARDPAKAAGVLDELHDASSLNLSDELLRAYEAARTVAPIDADARMRSILNGHARRLVLGTRNESQPGFVETPRQAQAVPERDVLQSAAARWRHGDYTQARGALIDAYSNGDRRDAVLVTLALLENVLGDSGSALARLPAVLNDVWTPLAVAARADALAELGRLEEGAAMLDGADMDAVPTSLLTALRARLGISRSGIETTDKGSEAQP